MSVDGKLFYLIMVDVDPEHAEAFDAWYNDTHMPEVVACPGFVRGWRFRAEHDGEHPRFAAAYEVEHDRVMETPELQAIRGFAHFADHVSNIQRFWFRGTFSHG